MTRVPLVVIQGFYGEENFGDDILLKVTYQLVRKHLPRENILVQTVRPSTYLEKLLGESPSIIVGNVGDEVNLPQSVRFLVIGGGGFLADHFRSANPIYLFSHFFVSLIGIYPFSNARIVWRKLKEKLLKKNYHDLKRIALGIEIGPFPVGSRREFRSALFLSQYDHVLVRDNYSLETGNQWKLRNLSLGVDLAYLQNNIFPSSKIKRKNKEGRRKIAILPRTWIKKDVQDRYVVGLQKAIRILETDFDIVFFAFQKNIDRQVIKDLNQNYPVIEWDPINQTIDEYLRIFSSIDILITGRFHGNILASFYGIPTITMSFYPKLQRVQKNLSSGTLSWDEPFRSDDLMTAVLKINQDYDAFSRAAGTMGRTQLAFGKQMEMAIDLIFEKHFSS